MPRSLPITTREHCWISADRRIKSCHPGSLSMGGIAMERQTFWDRMRSAYRRYDRMMEKQGFYVVLAVCVLIILVSAVLTFCQRREAQIPVVVEEAEPAGGSQNAQTLEDALVESSRASIVPAVPTEAPFAPVQPLSGVTIRLFTVEEPQYFAATHTWMVHPGIDLQSDYGAQVAACAAGTVKTAGGQGSMGPCVEIDHGNGYSSFYAGLAEAGLVRPGDPVRQGQVIGLAGNGVLAESEDGPHLHFEIRREGKPVDPLLVFLGIDNNDTI